MDTPVETITPAYHVGDRVRWRERRLVGTIVSCYESGGIPQWYGTRRVAYTHCYAIDMDDGRRIYGFVDTELEAVCL